MPPGARKSCSGWDVPTRTFSSIGEGPGAEEDKQGLPFVGRSGKLLDRLLAEELGITRDECYIANVVKCRPPENRDPRPDEIAACRPWLAQQVDLIRPKVVVTLGRFAAQLLLETTEGITKLRGRSYPFGDAVLVPTLHPAPRSGAERSRSRRCGPTSCGPSRSPHELGGLPHRGSRGHAVPARVVASLARRGDLILLVGELGVGKTAFVQGFAGELGITSPVTSPTFTLVHRYEGKHVLHHVDVYRLERLNEVTDLGLPEMLDEGITVIEWGDVVLPALPADFLEVRLSYVDDTDPTYTDDARDLAFTVVGPSWSTRAATIRAALER